MNVLSLCDLSGVMVQPWIENGHTATIVDTQHPVGAHQDGRLTRVGEDIICWAPTERFDLVFAFPPCTDLANSGARWFRDKGLQALIHALEIVEACRVLCTASGAPWMLENPVGQLSTYWRPPNWTFDPCDFGGYLDPPGDHYTKRTCLWTGGGFIMPSTRPVEPTEGSLMHRVPPGPERANIRSRTPEGFAKAVFVWNSRVYA